MKVATWLLGVGLLLEVSTANAAIAPPFGRFLGVVRHAGIQKDQLAKLDFIASREENNVLYLAAVLTLHFGGYDSGEYVTYHFEDVRFNLLTQTFIFNQSGQQVSLVAKQFSGSQFMGELRSAFTGELLKLDLMKDEAARPELSLIEPVSGEYQGKCVSKITGLKTDTRIQLMTYRSQGGAAGVGDPFRAYQIKGLLGEKGDEGCIPVDGYCTWAAFSSGSYNFFKKKLNLHGKFRNLACTVESNGLVCDNCELLTRISGETKEPRALTPPMSKSVFTAEATEPPPAIEGEVTSIQGEYQGWLHHEYLDVYQPASLSILTYQIGETTADTPTLRMSAVAALYFGEHGGMEALNHSFAERSFPNPLIAPQFLFQQKEGDIDAILQVTKLGNGRVEGIWYSHLFGRVGPFVLKKDGPPDLPKGLRTMEAVSGIYESSDWELGIVVGQGVSEPSTQNPFAPLGIEGWTILPDATPRIDLTGGTYDFYTGKIGFDYRERDAWVGWRPSRNRLHLKKAFVGSTAPFPEFKPTPFRLRKEQ